MLLPLLLLAACAESAPAGPAASPAAVAGGDGYATLPAASRDGIGKAYLGREISQVMGHLGAGWLERPEREREERTDLLVDALDLAPTDTVADVGAGTGYFTFRLAERVPEGRVLGVDIQPEMLAMLEAGEADRGLDNVEPVLGRVDDPRLPAGAVDLVLLVDAYHEFEFPREMMAGIAASLAPGGRVALVEYRGEDPAVPIKPLHKMTEAQAVREMRAAGLVHLRTDDRLPQQHLMFFGRPQDAAAPRTGGRGG
ncbi:hypothetical protein PSMK_10080 [Phycisphaera mikurensis NBRC 102666]|uniref:Methyltransferase domain-containing protein n=2 Tax=Phycisphaera TaxID=666508 RepID=I0ID29_PHYMF|nr:hypothetical protein PSMK_10080 [Phycisphaera mikurensis NBRC 102666]